MKASHIHCSQRVNELAECDRAMALPDQMQVEQNAQGQHAQALVVAEWDKAFGHGGSPLAVSLKQVIAAPHRRTGGPP